MTQRADLNRNHSKWHNKNFLLNSDFFGVNSSSKIVNACVSHWNRIQQFTKTVEFNSSGFPSAPSTYLFNSMLLLFWKIKWCIFFSLMLFMKICFLPEIFIFFCVPSPWAFLYVSDDLNVVILRIPGSWISTRLDKKVSHGPFWRHFENLLILALKPSRNH